MWVRLTNKTSILHGKKIIVGILAYVLVSVIKRESYECLKICTWIKNAFNKLLMACSEIVNMPWTVPIKSIDHLRITLFVIISIF